METASSSPSIQSVDLAGPVGRLEALLNSGSADAPYSALVCHPHPMGGGTMHNKVVYHAMKALHGLGIPVLRFNFRGTGRSEGSHDEGRGEQEDVRTALDWLDQEFHRPILFCGFSFGANVGLRACCGDARVRGLIALGLPVEAEGRRYTYKYLAIVPPAEAFHQRRSRSVRPGRSRRSRRGDGARAKATGLDCGCGPFFRRQIKSGAGSHRGMGEAEFLFQHFLIGTEFHGESIRHSARNLQAGARRLQHRARNGEPCFLARWISDHR